MVGALTRRDPRPGPRRAREIGSAGSGRLVWLPPGVAVAAGQVIASVQAPVQQTPVSHVVPSGRAGFVQAPELSQLPTSWHESGGGQLTVPTHWPLWQESPVVQALASSHVVPSSLAGLEQAPVVGSQVPTPWH